MTRIEVAADGYAIVDQLRSAIVDRNGVAKSFVQDRLNNLFRWAKQASTWETWTPVVAAGLTVGNGSWSGSAYNLVGTTCHFRLVFLFGSTSAITGAVTITPPFPASNGGDLYGFRGMLIDATSTDYLAHGFSEAGNFSVRCSNASLTYAASANLSSTIPFTWTTNDVIFLTGTYQIAT